MEVFLALIFGLAVACVVYVLGRTLVGSWEGGRRGDAAIGALLLANATPNGASAIVENLDAIDMPLPAASVSNRWKSSREAGSKALERFVGHAVNEPRSPRSRKSGKTTLPGPTWCSS